MNEAVMFSVMPVVVAAVIVILIAGRREADADRRRTPARYLGAVCFLSVFVTLFAAYAVVAQVSRFVIDDDRREPTAFDMGRDMMAQDFGYPRESGDAIWRGAVQALLVGAAAGAILGFHWRRRGALRTSNDFGASAAGRVDSAYAYAVCFVAAFVILLAAAFGLYGIFQIAAPGVATNVGGDVARQRGIAEAISLLALAAGAVLVFRVHWGQRGDATAPWSAPSAPTTEPAAV